MAPTTLPGQITTTTPKGRGENSEGDPIKICELLATMDGPTYLERVAVNNAGDIKKTKEALRKAFQCQLDGKGYSLVEILAMCPTNWKTDLRESLKFVDRMKEYFPLGIFKDVRSER